MSWIVDHAASLYVLLGLITIGLVLAWALQSQQPIIGCCCWYPCADAAGLASLFGTSDRKQLEASVHEMADAVVAGNKEKLFKHISPDFRYKEWTRDALGEKAQAAVKVYKISDVRIDKFEVEEVSRDKNFAKTRFRASVGWGDQNERFLIIVQADFVWDGAQWKLKTMRFYNPLVNQDKEMDLPFPR